VYLCLIHLPLKTIKLLMQKNLVDEGAAFMVKDSVVQENLGPLVIDAIHQASILETMHHKIQAFAVSNADTVIAEHIFSSVNLSKNF